MWVDAVELVGDALRAGAEQAVVEVALVVLRADGVGLALAVHGEAFVGAGGAGDAAFVGEVAPPRARGDVADRRVDEQAIVAVEQAAGALGAERVGGEFVEQPIVVEGAVLAERAELAVEQPPDLHAAFAALGAEHAHPPRGPAGGVGRGDRQQADGALDDPAAFQLIEVGGVRFRGRADPDHAAGGERPGGEHEHREQHERRGAPVPAPRPLGANPAPGANRAAQLALELVEHVVHASSLRLARSVFRPRCTR